MKIRPLGKITDEIEPLLCEMAESHELQKHEIIALISGYIDAHLPGIIEEYEDGSHPVLRYGPQNER